MTKYINPSHRWDTYIGELEIRSGDLSETLSLQAPASYIIYKDGNVIKAKNGKTGVVEFSDKDAATIIQQAIDASPDGGLIVIKKGNYVGYSPIVINKNVAIEGELSVKHALPLLLIHGDTVFKVDNSAIEAGARRFAICNIRAQSYLPNNEPGSFITTVNSEDKSNICILKNILFDPGLPTGVSPPTDRWAIYIPNIFNSYINNVELYTGTNGIKLTNESAVANNGNSYIGMLSYTLPLSESYDNLPIEGVRIQSVTGVINFIHVNRLGIWVPDAYAFTPATIGVRIMGANSIWIDGSNIEHMDKGIQIDNEAHNITVSKSYIRCKTGVLFQPSVGDAEITYNWIYCVVAGVNAWDGDKLVVLGNLIQGSDNGIYIKGANTVVDKNLIESAKAGVKLDGSAKVIVSKNVMRDNSIYDIVVTGTYGKVDMVKIIDNLLLSGSTNIRFEDNSATYAEIVGNYIHTGVAIAVPPDKLIRRRNRNYTTENSGTATITAGNTSVTVSHGLVATPSKVLVTPIGDPGDRYWVENITDTGFDIVVATAPAADITFHWEAEV